VKTKGALANTKPAPDNAPQQRTVDCFLGRGGGLGGVGGPAQRHLRATDIPGDHTPKNNGLYFKNLCNRPINLRKGCRGV